MVNFNSVEKLALHEKHNVGKNDFILDPLHKLRGVGTLSYNRKPIFSCTKIKTFFCDWGTTYNKNIYAMSASFTTAKMFNILYTFMFFIRILTFIYDLLLHVPCFALHWNDLICNEEVEIKFLYRMHFQTQMWLDHRIPKSFFSICCFTNDTGIRLDVWW